MAPSQGAFYGKNGQTAGRRGRWQFCCFIKGIVTTPIVFLASTTPPTGLQPWIPAGPNEKLFHLLKGHFFQVNFLY
jgi:hypothetical protein